MSVASEVAAEIQRITTNITNAYAVIAEKGGTLPETQNSDNLAEAIESISGGGGYIWDTPTVTLEGNEISTPIVENVTKYKVFDNGGYIGYVDVDGVWHGGDV